MTDSHQTIASRLKLARREMSYAARYDYRVINRSLDSAYRRLKKIIIDERLKTGRRSSHASPAVKGRG
jgi:guanylate kinase